MHIVHVHIHVKEEHVEAFKTASLKNARSSILEPGIVRFDVVQQADDLTQFVLVEVYRTSDDPARHRETPHYLEWRETVADMMAEPRQGIVFQNLFPDDSDW